MLVVALATGVRGFAPPPALLIAGDQLLQVARDGTSVPIRMPRAGGAARLLRLPGATVLLTRPPMRAAGGQALLLRDGEPSATLLGPADDLAPDARGDRVWLVRGTQTKTLTSYDAAGRERGRRQVANPRTLLMVTTDGVLDDEVVTLGGATPTVRTDAGAVLRRLPGPVQVLDVRGPRLLVLRGTCLQACEVAVWDVRTGSLSSGPASSGTVPGMLLVLDGALSGDGRSVALAARSGGAGPDLTGNTGQAVLLRGRLDGRALQSQVVPGGCSLLACRVTWSGDTVYASVDRTPGTLLRWAPRAAPTTLALRVPDVVDLSGLGNL